MIILYDNTSDDSGSISVSSESANYPVDNVRITLLGKRFEFTGNTSEVFNILFDSGATCGGIGLVTNITDTGTITINVYHYNVVDGGSAATTGTDITDGGTAASTGPDILDGNKSIDETFSLTGSDANNHGVILQEFATEISISEISITFADSTNSENIQIKRFATGPVLNVGGIKYGPKINYVDTSIRRESRTGASYGVKGYIYREFEISLPATINSKKNELYEFLESVGNYKPFFCDVFCDNSELPIYGLLNQSLISNKHQSTSPQTFNIGFKIKETF